MAAERVRVLLVEDDPDDYVLVRDWLAECEGLRFELTWVDAYEAALEALARGGFDVCLLDYRLGRHDGLELLREARRRGWTGPLVLLTGQSDRAVDLQAMQAGAADYLVKGQLSPALLERAIRYALERRQMHAQLEARVKERTEELARANAALAEADQRKNEFLAMLAHELRNPLAPLRNAIEILRVRSDSDAEVVELGKMMARQVDHMVRLVDDLLDVSRITRGKIELRKEKVELAAVVGRCVEASASLMHDRRHQVETTIAPEPVWLEADPARLEQVLSNLLTNAAKYTPPGGRIHVMAKRTGGSALITVQDNGIGIRAEALPRVFDLFTQADRVPGQVAEGLGIGLSLVRRLVEMHGGTVSVSSPGPGQGSTFVVRLPLRSSAGGRDDRREKTEEAAASSLAPGGSNGHSLRVLVTDDNVDAAESMALLLRLMGHDVCTAHDGPGALAAARAFRPQAVFLDVGLPDGMDGYEVARQLRREPGLEGALVVAVTGFGLAEDVARARDAGMDHHVTKPADPAVLEAMLADVPGTG